MKALTICQPYAELIARGDKRIENRTWPTSYRGPILIHAGKSRDWLICNPAGTTDEEYGIPIGQMAFGAVVATAFLAACLRADAILAGKHDDEFPWARSHKHVGGPWCWVFESVNRLPVPVAARGAQGLFDIE